MTPAEARKLLGGHAAGILTEAERRALYGAALGDQALFDALMDEEALRELLADPEARARLLVALAPAPPKVVPFWRRPGVLGAAAGLLMASLAGLTWLRSPQAPAPARIPAPGPARPEPAPRMLSLDEATVAPPAPAKAASPVPAPAPPASAAVPEAAPAQGFLPAAVPPPAPPPAPASAPEADFARQEAVAAEARMRGLPAAGAARDRAEKAAKKAAAPAPPPAAAVVDVLGEVAPTSRTLRARAAQAPPLTWTLAPLPDGATLVTVSAPTGAPVVLLRRAPGGVEVLRAQVSAGGSGRTQWQYRLRLKEGEALDLYQLDAPVADPAALPETGPVAGFRTRIHPAAKKDPAP